MNSPYNTTSPTPPTFSSDAYGGLRLRAENGIPHFINGISGHRFQTPFASPPAVGESSPLINVLWGTANIVIGLLLILKVGVKFDLNLDTLTFFAGGFLIAIVLAWYFDRVRNQQLD